MQNDKREQIRKRAYEIWEAEGMAAGNDEDHWRRAEMEIEAEEHRRQDPMAKSDSPPKRQHKVNSRQRARL